jgi:calnexin
VKVPNVRDLLFSDKKTHLLTLIVRPSNTFSMMIDMNEVLSGDLRSDESFAPGLTPPKIISDPNEKKPAG